MNTQTSMYSFKSTSILFALLALAVSCNKKEKEVEPTENCRFVGKSFEWENKTSAETTTQTYKSDFKQDDQGRLTLVTVSQTESRKDSTGVYASITGEETYELLYNAEGFLTQLKRRDVRLQQGSATYEFGYANLRYRKGKLETTSVTNYIYEDGRLQSSKFVGNLVVQGDNLPAATFPENYTIVYKYDAKGSIQTATSNVAVTNYVNGIRASEVSADGNTVTKYNEQGKTISYSSPFDQRTFKYDQRGNQIFQEASDKGVFIFSYETKFDEHPNPENMVPSRFKGIPEAIKIPYGSDDVNNWTESKFISRSSGEPNIKTNVLTYHANGLPETSTIKEGTNAYQTTQITKFNYENCD